MKFHVEILEVSWNEKTISIKKLKKKFHVFFRRKYMELSWNFFGPEIT